MPTRMIREGLLDSERYWSVTIEARQFFWHLMLLADDFGCVSLAPVFIRRRCFDSAPSHEKITSLVSHLMDVDLIRVYEVDGARYAFIPRFRQRLKRMTLAHPQPPAAILSGDADALSKFKEIKLKAGNPAASSLPDGRPPAPEEKRSEEKRSEEVLTIAEAMVAKTALSPCPHREIIEAYHQLVPSGRRVNLDLWNGTRQKHLQTRWRESPKRQSLDFWERFFTYVSESTFLTGRATPAPGRKPFEVSLDWIVAPTNFAKISEGAYHNA